MVDRLKGMEGSIRSVRTWIAGGRYLLSDNEGIVISEDHDGSVTRGLRLRRMSEGRGKRREVLVGGIVLMGGFEGTGISGDKK